MPDLASTAINPFAVSQLGPTDQAHQALINAQAQHQQIQNQMQRPFIPLVTKAAQMGMDDLNTPVAPEDSGPKLPGLLSQAAPQQQQPPQQAPQQPPPSPQGVQQQQPPQQAPQQPPPSPQGVQQQPPQQRTPIQANTAPPAAPPSAPLIPTQAPVTRAPTPMQTQGTVQQDAVQQVESPPSDREQALQEARVRAFDANAAANLAPLPTAMDQGHQQLYKALMYGASTGAITADAANGIRTSYEQGQIRENERRVRQANIAYSSADSVAKAAEAAVASGADGYTSNGTSKAWLALYTVDPKTALQIPRTTSNEQMKDMFSQYGGSVFRYTGRPVALTPDGYIADATTNDPILGHDHQVGLSAPQYVDLQKMLGADTIDYNYKNTPVKWTRLQIWNDTHPTDQVKTPDQLAQRFLLKSGRTGIPVATLISQEMTSVGAREPAPVPVPGAPTAPGDLVKAPGNRTPAQIPASNTGAPKPVSTTAGVYYSTNAPTGKLDLSRWQPAPTFGNTIPGGGVSDLKRPGLDAYTQQRKDTDAEMKDRATRAGNDIVRNQVSLKALQSAEVGPLSNIPASIKNTVNEIFKTNSTILDDVRSGDPAAYNVLEKMLAQGSTENVGSMGTSLSGGRVSGPVIDFAKISSANIAQARPALEYLLKLDLAHKYYDRQMAGVDYPVLRDKVDISNFSGQYTSNNKPEDIIPRYIASMDDSGRLNTNPGSWINPIAAPDKQTYDNIKSGQVYIGKSGIPNMKP